MCFTNGTLPPPSPCRSGHACCSNDLRTRVERGNSVWRVVGGGSGGRGKGMFFVSFAKYSPIATTASDGGLSAAAAPEAVCGRGVVAVTKITLWRLLFLSFGGGDVRALSYAGGVVTTDF